MRIQRLPRALGGAAAGGTMIASLARHGMACAVLAATSVAGQEEGPRDAPYFPTPQSVVERMLEVAKVGPNDYVIDLGSGDGRIVITAALKYGARGVGIEIEPHLVAASNSAARRAGVAERAKFMRQDLFATDISRATVVTLYLFRELNIKLRPRILSDLRPGTRVVTHDWDMGDWEPDFAETIAAPDKPVGIVRASKLFLWYVPAQVAGTWRLATPFAGTREATLALAQRYQYFDGTLAHTGAKYAVGEGRAHGTAIRFRIADGAAAGEYVGTAASNELTGEVLRDGVVVGRWHAIRE